MTPRPCVKCGSTDRDPPPPNRKTGRCRPCYKKTRSRVDVRWYAQNKQRKSDTTMRRRAEQRAREAAAVLDPTKPQWEK